MAKAAGEYNTRAGSRSPPPLCGPYWISLREAVEREWRRLGWSDPAMGEVALAAIDSRLESGDLFGKLIEGDREERIEPERWREKGGELKIHVDGNWRWFDDEQGVKVVDLATLRVKSRREPDRQLLVLVWAPPKEVTLSTATGDGASGASAAPQSKERLSGDGPAATPPLSGTKRWVYEFMKHHPDANAREVWENRPDDAAVKLKTVQNLVSECRKLPGLS